MGILSELRQHWTQTTTNNQNLNHHNINHSNSRSFLIASPAEERKVLEAKRCTREGVRAGLKAGAVACVVSAVPTFAAVRMIPWAKANLNYTAQALIICSASISTYFITVDKTILECARRNAQYNKTD